MKNKTSAKQKKNEDIVFDSNSLIQALLFAEDILSRSFIPFVLLDDTAQQCILNSNKTIPELKLKEINLGILEKEITVSGTSMLKTILPEAEIDNNLITFNYGTIPIIIWRIKKHTEYFERPDQIFFYITEFKIPNPFDEYWKIREDIQ